MNLVGVLDLCRILTGDGTDGSLLTRLSGSSLLVAWTPTVSHEPADPTSVPLICATLRLALSFSFSSISFSTNSFSTSRSNVAVVSFITLSGIGPWDRLSSLSSPWDLTPCRSPSGSAPSLLRPLIPPRHG